jgi:hypothetical protein
MVVTRTDTSQSPTITATNFENSLHTAMLNAGFTLWHTYTASGQNRRIYREVLNSSTYGTAFYEIRINTTTRELSVTGYVAFNTTTNTGTGAITSFNNFTPTTGDAINYIALNGGSEFRVVLIRQASTLAVVGQLRPSLNKPSWWNENNYPYVWYMMSLTSNQWNNLTTAGGTALSPWSSATAVLVSRSIRGTVPGGQREISNAVELGAISSASPGGTCGVFSNDIAQSSTEGLVLGVDMMVVTAGTEEYLVIQAASGGLVVRTV